MPDRRLPTNQRALMLTTINDRSMPSLNIRRKLMFIPSRGPALKRPSHGKLKLANPCWQTQVGVCERHKNSRQSRFYLTPTVCKRVCRLFMCRLTRLGEVDQPLFRKGARATLHWIRHFEYFFLISNQSRAC